MRTIGLDYGERTIGVAVSDELGLTAQGVKTIRRSNREWDELAELVRTYGAAAFVVGLPRNMNGSYGERAEAARAFARGLERRFAIPVVLWDERLSTIGAERALLEANLSRAKRKQVIDKMAAVFILQGYLDHKRTHPENAGKTPVEYALPFRFAGKFDNRSWERYNDTINSWQSRFKRGERIMADDNKSNNGFDTDEDDSFDVVVLNDDEGNEHEFMVLSTINMDENTYYVLLPLEETEEETEEEADAIILKLGVDENGEEMLFDIEDDEEWEKVADAWEEMEDELISDDEA